MNTLPVFKVGFYSDLRKLTILKRCFIADVFKNGECEHFWASFDASFKRVDEETQSLDHPLKAQ